MKIEFVYSSIYDTLLSGKKEFFSPDHKKKIRENLRNVESEWRKYEQKVLSEVESLLGIRWPEDKIKCYIVTKSMPFSDPLTIPSYKKKDESIDVLIHELIHQMISGKNYYLTKESWKYFFEKHENESLKTKLHIPLHAIHKYLYLKFFDKDRLERDKKKVRVYDNKDYRRSWEIVENEGYQKIIDEFRKRIKRDS